MPEAPRTQRFACLDTLRGVAVLGILMANIQLFAMVWVAADAPLSHMDFTSAINQSVWIITQTLFSEKFITLFSALFGAGFVLMIGEGDVSHTRHFRRMAWLLFFGLVHAYLFWFGDILVPYALAGMVLISARRMTPVGLLGLGFGLIAFTGIMVVGYYLAMGAFLDDPESLALSMGFNAGNLPRIEALYQSGFLNRLPYNMGMALQAELIQIIFVGGRIAGVMLLGMAAFKSGFLTLEWSVKRYAISGGVTLGLGVLLSAWGALHALGSNFDPATIWQWSLAQYVGSLILAFGYAAMIMLVSKMGVMKPVQNVFRSVGQMAFTNYLSQTLILTFIFVGFPGLGLFGQIERGGQALIVIAIWVAQLAWSPFWLKHFHHGPMEWAWRSLTYGKSQAWKRQVED